MRAANLIVRFLLELAALAGTAYWGAGATSSAAVNILLAILVPFALATVWGIWSAPKAGRRLGGRRLIALELVLLALACALIATAGAPLFAALLGLVAIANGALLRRLDRAPPGP